MDKGQRLTEKTLENDVEGDVGEMPDNTGQPEKTRIPPLHAGDFNTPEDAWDWAYITGQWASRRAISTRYLRMDRWKGEGRSLWRTILVSLGKYSRTDAILRLAFAGFNSPDHEESRIHQSYSLIYHGSSDTSIVMTDYCDATIIVLNTDRCVAIQVLNAPVSRVKSSESSPLPSATSRFLDAGTEQVQ